jgi:hypothetical protein
LPEAQLAGQPNSRYARIGLLPIRIADWTIPTAASAARAAARRVFPGIVRLLRFGNADDGKLGAGVLVVALDHAFEQRG